MTLDDQLQAAKARYTAETAKALAGDDSAWRRAEIHGREVRRLQAEIKRRPAPVGIWAESARLRNGEG